VRVDGNLGERRLAAAVRLAARALVGIALLFLCLHFVHLRADFPNHSPWVDWAKYTDEGWYGDGAIRHFQTGRWNVPGDFNPAAALPVWPVLEAVVFRFTGVGIVPARALTVAIFVLTLVFGYVLLRRWAWRRGSGPLAPAAAVLLLAVNPFCYAFTRLAILEPILILLTLLALLTAAEIDGESSPGEHRRIWPLLALGILLPLMVLAKTTALFLFPSIFWMVWARLGYRWQLMLRLGAIPAGIGAALWLLYFGLLVRLHFLEDYRYLFSANAYTAISAQNFRQVVIATVKDGMWIGPVLFPLALLMMMVALVRWRSLRDDPLTVSLMLWAGGYAAFLAYHANLQPRYYLVVAVPLIFLLPMALDSLWRAGRGAPTRGLVMAIGGVLAVVAAVDASRVVQYVRKPQYTLIRAAEQIRNLIAADPQHSQLVLSISGSELSLMTGVRSICDDFGTTDLEQRVATYRPGWYVSWNQVDDDKMEALTPLFELQRVAAFPAMDDSDRNLLILYRLDPAMAPGRRRRRSRKPMPKVLVTRIGQQPSATQLQH